jgi:serine/threonine protein kinase/tetratricopeptide (TPR) repeat protein
MPSERIQRKIDSLLDEAESALTRNDWQAAIERAKAVLALDPDNEDARGYREAAQRGASEESGSAIPAGLSRTGAAPPTTADSLANLPLSFASGRYTVKRFLGEGGKKKVYLAHDNTLDRDVAFALIKSESLDVAARRRILREAQAMGRLGDHPNIVPIHDLGTEGNQPFMVLPLMQGGDTAELIEKAKDHRPPLEQVLRMSRDICEGLSFAHSKGLVHRDLKPGNVWLTESPSGGTTRWVAKIGDFGLALPLDQSRLTREGFMVGTVAYMPPEQAMGGEITPRADLYSLGCMLYEMVTGRPPFLGDDDIAIIGQHINTPPVAPTWHRPDCPKPLEALIMRLLAKDPAQRPESAKDVLTALEAVDATATAASLPSRSDSQQEQGRSLDSMSSGVFVGRHKEMNQLRAALEETLSGHGRMVTLVGEPGIGKTRTAQELATYAGLRRCQVLWGRCYDGGGAPPYWPWVQAIRQYVQEKEPEQVRKEMGSTASVVAEIVQDVKEKIPGLHPPPQLENPESSRFRLFDAIAAFLKNASRTQSIVLVLDDLHWADKPTLLLLEFVARELANSRILLVGTYRDVELNRRHPLAVTLGDLTKDRLFERVLLRGLQKEDVAKFVEIAAGVVPPNGLVEAIFTQTEGNPLFVTEVARWLVQEGALTRERVADRTSWSMPIPEGVRDVIGKRLDRLSARCNDVLTTASVIGRRFALAALAKLHHEESLPLEERLTENQLLETVEEALAARVIEELPTGPGHYQFSHALIQETLASELSTTRKVRLHARIALVLEDLYRNHLGERAAELAIHFSEAEMALGTEKLVKYSLIAGEKALSEYAYEDAGGHFERARSAMANSPETVQLARATSGLAEVFKVLPGVRQRQRGLDYAREAFDIFARLGDSASAIRVAQQGHALGGLRGGIEFAEKALALVEPGSLDEGWILARYGTALIAEGRPDDALRALGRALDIGRSQNELKLEARATTHLLQRLCWNNEFGDAAEAAPRAIELMRAGEATEENEARIASHLTWVALALGRAGWSEEMVAMFRRAAERMRSPAVIAYSLWWESALAALRGDWEVAQRTLAVLGERVPQNDWLGESTLAWIDLQTGRLDPTSRRLERLKSAPDLEGGWADSLNVGLRALAHELTGAPPIDKVQAIADDLERNHSRTRCERQAAQTTAALVAVIRRDAVGAERRYQELGDHQGGLDPWVWVAIGRLMGRLAQLLGRLDAAEQHFQDALTFCRGARYRPELTWTLYDYAELLLSRNGPGDRGRAVKLHEEAITIARDLALKPLIERILRRREVLGA